MLAGIKRYSRSRSTASRPRLRGTCMTCIGCNISITAMSHACGDGKTSTSPTGDHPYMKNWWVPGLQIGYEHTFIHQVADFLIALGNKEPAAPTFADGLATDYVTAAVLKSAQTRQWERVAGS